MMHHIWCIQIFFSEIALSAFLGLLHTKFELNLHAKLHAHAYASARSRVSTQLHVFSEFDNLPPENFFLLSTRHDAPYMVHGKQFQYTIYGA